MPIPGEFSEGVESDFESDFDKDIFGDDDSDVGGVPHVSDDLKEIYGEDEEKPILDKPVDPEDKDDTEDDTHDDEDNPDDTEDDEDSETKDQDDKDSENEEDEETKTEDEEDQEESGFDGLTLDNEVINQANRDYQESLDYISKEIDDSYAPQAQEIISAINNVRSEMAELEKLYNTPDEYGELPSPKFDDVTRYNQLKAMETDIINKGNALEQRYVREKTMTSLHLRVAANIKVHPGLAPYENELLQLYKEGFQPRTVVELYNVAKMRYEHTNPNAAIPKPAAKKSSGKIVEKPSPKKDSQASKVDRESKILEQAIHGKRRMAPTKGMTSTGTGKGKGSSKTEIVEKVGQVGADILNSIQWD